MSNELLAREIAERIAKDVAELSDRTSPDDWPEAMLVTAEELILICERNCEEAIREIAQLRSENSRLSMYLEAIGKDVNIALAGRQRT